MLLLTRIISGINICNRERPVLEVEFPCEFDGYDSLGRINFFYRHQTSWRFHTAKTHSRLPCGCSLVHVVLCGFVREINWFNAGAGLIETGLSFPGKTVARHIAPTGSALVHPVRAGPVPVHFAAGYLLGVPARAGSSLPAHYVWSRPFGVFEWAAQMLGHFPRPVPGHLVRA